MAQRTRTGLMTALLIGLSVSLPLPAKALDDAQKQEFGAFIREYLLANPEIIEEMSRALEIKKEAETREMAQTAITNYKDAIFNGADDVVLGNPKGDVTVVEFFDYNCGYCKRALNDLTSLLEDDSNIRLVLKEFPILGPDSMAAHRVAMSLRKIAPEKYGDFHVRLMGGDVRATEDRAFEIAAELGVDEEALRAGMEDPAIEASIRQTYEIANALGISGTPSFVIGDEAVFGAVGEEALMAKIANMRECQSTTC